MAHLLIPSSLSLISGVLGIISFGLDGFFRFDLFCFLYGICSIRCVRGFMV
jgi:uncharacterized membrane protein YuzA (DUF378 family)